MATKSRPRAPRSRESAARPATSGAGVFILLLLVVLLSVHLGKIYLARRTNLMGVEWETKSKQLAILKKEQINLEMEKETYTDGPYILKHAREMGLAPAQPGQVRRLSEPLPPLPADEALPTLPEPTATTQPATKPTVSALPTASARSPVAAMR